MCKSSVSSSRIDDVGSGGGVGEGDSGRTYARCDGECGDCDREPESDRRVGGGASEDVKSSMGCDKGDGTGASDKMGLCSADAWSDVSERDNNDPTCEDLGDGRWVGRGDLVTQA